MAGLLGAVKRVLLIAVAVAVAGAAVYQLVVRDTVAAPHVAPLRPIAKIGSGSEAVGVAANGRVLDWLPAPPDGSLPQLPLTAPPPGRSRLRGTMLEQARVLGRAPAALRPHIESTSYGESGVDVTLRSGIELRFGQASRIDEKWQAAATVLADPSITALDYVDLQVPSRPTVGGSGHSLPPAG